MPGYTPAGASSKRGAGLQTVIVLVVIAAVAVGGYFIFRKKDGNGKPAAGNGKGKPPATGTLPGTGTSTGTGTVKTTPIPAGDVPGKSEYQKGKYKEAAEKLTKYVEKDGKNDAAAHFMLGRCYLEMAKSADAEKALARAVELDPRGPAGGSAAQYLGDSLYSRCYANVEDQDRTKWERIRELYSTALRNSGYGPGRARLVERIGKLNTHLLWGKMTTKDSELHVVKTGDTVEKIAVAYGLPRDCAKSISRINNIPKDNIHPGQKLKIVKPLKMELVVSKSNYTLTAYLNGYLFAEFRVGIGKSGSTPTGEFVIAADGKDKNPNWTQTLDDGTKVVRKFGDPENILGTRWMGFVDKREIGATGLGIHGTSKPDSIGKASSAGCIRMLNKEVELLYDFTPGNTKVTIVK
jgi:LysM repeat protein